MTPKERTSLQTDNAGDLVKHIYAMIIIADHSPQACGALNTPDLPPSAPASGRARRRAVPILCISILAAFLVCIPHLVYSLQVEMHVFALMHIIKHSA
jgi:hypothetical protein